MRYTLVLCLLVVLPACSAAFPKPKFVSFRTDVMERHVDEMPPADLSPYAVLYIEDFETSDHPKLAEESVPREWFATYTLELPTKFPDYVKFYLTDPQFSLNSFDKVIRDDGPAASGTLIVRGTIDDVVLGSDRLDKHHFEATVHVLDGATKETLVSLPLKREYPGSCPHGEWVCDWICEFVCDPDPDGLLSFIRSVARELAMYLHRCKNSPVDN